MDCGAEYLAVFTWLCDVSRANAFTANCFKKEKSQVFRAVAFYVAVAATWLYREKCHCEAQWCDSEVSGFTNTS